MGNRINKKELIEFENEIIKIYETGKIQAPIHLSGGNETQVIKIFKKMKKDDWVFTTHRSHYHALLKSNNPKWVKKEILEGRSIHLNSKRYKLFSSAIVGGNLPIALGVALSLKLKKSKNKVWCFIGDMASEMGIFEECTKYAKHFCLPITFIIEDNSLSCYTPTHKAWGKGYGSKRNHLRRINDHIVKYKYKRKYPHVGIGRWVHF